MSTDQKNQQSADQSADQKNQQSADQKNQQSADQKNAPEMISKAEFDKVLSEMHKYKTAAKALDDKANEDKLARMKEANQWKEIAEAKEQEAAKAKDEMTKIQSSFLNEKRFSAAKEKCMALGLRPEAVGDLEMRDVEQVQIETTSTGRINVLGADKFAERLKSIKPHWFTDKKAPNVNTGNTTVLDPSAPVTVEMVLKAEKEAKKTGDQSKYHELFKKYQTQRAQGAHR